MTPGQIMALYSEADTLRKENRERYEGADSRTQRAATIQQAIDAYRAAGVEPPMITE